MSNIEDKSVHLNGKRDELEARRLHRIAVIDSMQDFAADQIELLVPVEKSWQPSDFMPDSAAPTFFEEVQKIQALSKELPDDVLVALVGDMITEEALPSYQTMLNRFAGVEDRSGTDLSPWGQWSRGWTAEENRHGDLLNRFLFLSGRVDMRAIEVTIHHLIRNGFNPGIDSDAYNGFVYTSFQERATRVSHGNVAKLAGQAGHDPLMRICQRIAGDEGRHEEAYKRFMGKIFEIDPNGAMMSFLEMMKKQISMPALLMDDGKDPDIFEKFEAIAQRLGVYTANDYADIVAHLVERWDLPGMTGLNSEATAAQEYLCKLPERYKKIARRMESKIKDMPPVSFSWINGRTA